MNLSHILQHVLAFTTAIIVVNADVDWVVYSDDQSSAEQLSAEQFNKFNATALITDVSISFLLIALSF